MSVAGAGTNAPGVVRRWRWAISLALVCLAGTTAPALAETPPMFLLKWGSRGFGDGQFRTPTSIAVDPAGGVYVRDGENQRVQKFTTLGVYQLQWSGLFRGLDTDAAGTIYVFTSSPSRIGKYSASGELLGEFPVSLNAGAIAVDATGENVYLVGGPAVRQYRTDGTFVRSWTTIVVSSANNTGVAVGPSGHVYVSEGGPSHSVYKYTADGVFVRSWGGSGTGDGQIDSPYGVAVDADENVYVCDSGNERIQKFTSEGVFLTKWGTFGDGDGEFLGPVDVAVDGDGNVYVVDSGNDRIQKFGDVPTPTTPTSWGRIKARYR